MRLGKRRDLARFGHAPAPRQIEHRHAGHARFEVFAKGMRVGKCLARTDPGLGMSTVFAQIGEVVEPERVFMPVGIEGLEFAREPAGHGEAPQRVKLHHDVHAVADGRADFSEWLERLVKLGR